MSHLYLIKTLPHLHELHVRQLRLAAYTSSFSWDLWQYFEKSQLLTPKKLKLQNIRSLISHYQNVTPGSPTAVQEYSLKGDTLQLWAPGYKFPIRIEFFDDAAERMYTYDPDFGRKMQEVNNVFLSAVHLADKTDLESLTVDHEANEFNQGLLTTFIPESSNLQNESTVLNFDFTYAPLFWNRLDIFAQEVARLDASGYQVMVLTQKFSQLPEAVQTIANKGSHKLAEYLPRELPAGFISESEKLAVFTDREIFGTIFLSQQKTDNKVQKILAHLEGEIAVGDFVVHEDYGVAIYSGLTQERIDNNLQDYLELQFAAEEKLLLPIGQLQKISRYIGGDGHSPKLSRLGKGEWSQETTRARKTIRILARELVEHYARREMAEARAIKDEDSEEYQQFVERFPYEATPDQLRATNEIIADLTQVRPMNRLLVGDVGFGKTEVIMRATFKVVENGGQVAILCPTTVLSAQHFQVFTERFKASGIKVGVMSRFQTAKENQQTIAKLETGEIDIVVGTHRLLSSDVKFKQLDLLVIDEEQRFGVAQKEKIKKFNYTTHQLSVSATPIPRTLSMALANIQTLSLIANPPKGRKPVQTSLHKLDWQLSTKAIRQELERGGQVYFVHNRVQDLAALQAKLIGLMPELKVTIVHGQMSPDKLDHAFTDFYLGKYQVLLATAIIENGLDLPNVNTMIIHQAQNFGLSQLYQLRGRIGRSDKQAYCYMFYQKVTDEEKKSEQAQKYLERLETIINASDLGAGFHIASRDLEIRGAGNLLGAEQHGHISAIGYTLYIKLLAQEVSKLQNLADYVPGGVVSF